MAERTGGFINPEKILAQFVSRPDLSAADLGCGHGYFAVPLAKTLQQGKVFACDVRDEALQAVRSKARLENIANIETIRCNLENLGGSKIETSSIDLVILANILYQSRKKDAIIREASRIIKEEGELAIIDWRRDASLAPKEGWLLTTEQAIKLAEAEEFKLERELEITDGQHFGLVFRR